MTPSSRFPCDFLGWSLLRPHPSVCPSGITPEDQRVHHGHTLGMDDDWIEIDRIDVIGMIGGKLGQPILLMVCGSARSAKIRAAVSATI
jgi:hypothetical protein